MVPKRAIGAIVTTLLALALLLGFKTPESPALAAPSAADAAIVGSPTPTGSTETETRGTTAAAYVDGTVTGPVVSTRYGDVEVQVTISGGVITDVTTLQMPADDRRSASISARAEPLLRASSLEAQSADIDMLSGATYTSEAYAMSLQAALDQART
jgi:uncharacterized protein with FMN-binding domain